MKNKLLYLTTMIKDYRLGAVTRSSRFVVRRVLGALPLEEPGATIVEYGPGDGVITARVLEGMHADSRLVAIETNPDFVAMLRGIDDTRFHLHAMGVEEWLDQAEVSGVDAVFSGIPFTFFSPARRDAIVQRTHALLREGGAFVVYQNSLLMRPYLAKHFSSVTTAFEPRNFLPYFVMRAVK